MHLFVRTTCGVLWVLVAIVRPRPYTLSSREWRTYSTAQAAIFIVQRRKGMLHSGPVQENNITGGGDLAVTLGAWKIAVVSTTSLS